MRTSERRSFRIPLCGPDLSGNEWSYVKECLESGWVSTAGTFVHRFAQLVAKFVGASYAVPTTSGTAALHVGLLVAGVRANEEVLVPALTFVASANVVRYVGAWPVFVDVDPLYWQMDAEKVLNFFRRDCRWRRGGLVNRMTGRRIKAILPVHLLGHPADIDPIREAAEKYGLAIVEDAAQSLGATYKGRRVGEAAQMACFSFNGNKIATAAAGGIIVTSDEEWAQRAHYLTTQARDDAIEGIHRSVGYNYRLNGLQAALGCAQMERIEDLVSAKRRNAGRYEAALAGVPGLSLPAEAPWASSTFWLYTVQISEKEYGMDSRALLGKLGKRGIEARLLHQPLHRSPAHAGAYHSQIEVADRIYRDALSLPSSVVLGKDEIRKIAGLIRKLGKRVSGRSGPVVHSTRTH